MFIAPFSIHEGHGTLGAVSIHSMHDNLAVVKRKCPAYNNSCMLSEKKGGHARAKIWKHIFLCRCWLLTACQWIASHTPFQNDSKTLYYFHPFSMLTVLYSFAASLPPSQDGPAYLGSFPATCPQRCNNHSSLLKGRYLFWDFFFLFLVPWSPAPLIPWCPGHLVTAISSPYCLVPGALVLWSSGPLVPCSFFVSFFLTCLLLCFNICFIFSHCLLFMFLLLVYFLFVLFLCCSSFHAFQYVDLSYFHSLYFFIVFFFVSSLFHLFSCFAFLMYFLFCSVLFRVHF